jgi:hypothetical protein
MLVRAIYTHVAGAEMTTDADANVPQPELERTTVHDRNVTIKKKLEVSAVHLRHVHAWHRCCPTICVMHNSRRK